MLTTITSKQEQKEYQIPLYHCEVLKLILSEHLFLCGPHITHVVVCLSDSTLYRLCRGLAPDGTPLLSSNSALLLFQNEPDLVKLNKPLAITRNPELQNMSRISSTEKALMSLLNITPITHNHPPS